MPCAGSDSFTVVSARRSWSDHHQVTIQFSEGLNLPSASSPANYSIERATVQSARLGAIANTVVLTTSALDFEPAPTLRVDRVQNSSGTQTIAGLRILVNLEPILPSDMGQTVNGFQDDFDTTTRAARWRSLGPDVYTQVDGILNVSAGGGDPNHLVYVDPVYAGVTQEVLARIRPAIMSDHATAFAGIAVGVPTNSLTLAIRGGMNLLLENANANGGPPQRHGRLLNDYTTFGPHLSTAWTTNVWYWLRLLQHSTNAGANVFAKLWRADGDTPEPPGWQQTWKIEAGRSGYAGFRAGIRQTPAVNADYQVDYVLIKASQLPPTKPMPRAFLPDATGTRLTIERLPTNALVSWPAASGPARLEQSTNLTTWSAASEPVVSNANRFGATVALAKPVAYFRTTTLAGPPPPASFAFRFGTASSQTLTGS
ncbi:MAG: hypothetical protein FJ405_17620, partial [Verrucomicrobia bacterium]|nr:hypothetical protein [Verrucomicrobiota bacterium]